MANTHFELELDQIRKSLGLRAGEDKGDVLVRAIQSKQHLEQSYKTIYGGLAKYRGELRESEEDTAEQEAELQELMRSVVLLSKAGIRRQETTINELVPGSFPLPQDEPTTSFDFDCADAAAAASAVCVVSTGAGNPEICLAALVIVAIACG